MNLEEIVGRAVIGIGVVGGVAIVASILLIGLLALPDVIKLIWRNL